MAWTALPTVAIKDPVNIVWGNNVQNNLIYTASNLLLATGENEQTGTALGSTTWPSFFNGVKHTTLFIPSNALTLYILANCKGTGGTGACKMRAAIASDISGTNVQYSDVNVNLSGSYTFRACTFPVSGTIAAALLNAQCYLDLQICYATTAGAGYIAQFTARVLTAA